jgi:hypothetical protein
MQSGVGVEKGTKAVISVNFSAYRERTFNNHERTSEVETPEMSFSTATRHSTQNPGSQGQ